MSKIILSVAVFLLFLSCSKTNNGSGLPQTSFGIIPLSVGNFWQFNKVSFDSTGNPIDTTADEIDILGETSINGVIYYQQNQQSITNINAPSFFSNIDSNTLEKYDSAIQYTFFKRVTTDSTSVDSWNDTVTSHCKGHNYLYGFTGTTSINGYNCLRNVVYVNDCTGMNFEQWVYYIQYGFGFVRIEHYVIKQDGTFYLQFAEDLKNYHVNH
jgi:hypothetical protein